MLTSSVGCGVREPNRIAVSAQSKMVRRHGARHAYSACIKRVAFVFGGPLHSESLTVSLPESL